MVEGDGLVAEIRANLGEQCGVEGDGDGVRGAGEHFPLDCCNLGIKTVANLEDVNLGVALGADGIGTVSVGVKARGILATVTERANHLKGSPVCLSGLEEQRLHLVDQGAGRGASLFALVLDDLVVGALLELVAKVVTALDVAGPLVHTGILNGLAIGCGDVELAVGVLGKALLLRHGLDALGVQAVLGVVEVDIVVEVADVGVDRGDVVGELHADPLVTGKRGKQPGLVVVGDDDLVVGADALLVNQAAEELDALAGRGALAQDDAGVVVLADAGVSQGVCCLGICIHTGA